MKRGSDRSRIATCCRPSGLGLQRQARSTRRLRRLKTATFSALSMSPLGTRVAAPRGASSSTQGLTRTSHHALARSRKVKLQAEKPTKQLSKGELRVVLWALSALSEGFLPKSGAAPSPPEPGVDDVTPSLSIAGGLRSAVSAILPAKKTNKTQPAAAGTSQGSPMGRISLVLSVGLSPKSKPACFELAEARPAGERIDKPLICLEAVEHE